VKKVVSKDLDKKVLDHLAAYASAGVSMVPFAGSLLGQVLTDVIPNQRIDRIIEFVRVLDNRLASIEDARKQELLEDPAKQDLIVMGGNQAARALSNERLEYIAEAVANGIDSEATKTARKNRLLGLLGELDDDQLAILHAYGVSYGTGNADGWAKVDRPSPAHLGSPVAKVDESRLYEAGKDHLLRLGLLERKFSSVKKGQIPEFDTQAGTFKGRISLSYLGRMLLREIGLPTELDKRANENG
jgi:hypothetical protein